MIEIKKHGSRIMEQTCPSCDCVFTHLPEDGRIMYTVDEGFRDIGIRYGYAIECPECECEIRYEVKR